jgi:glycosyltransferase involved in cell wall biosynthesis
MKIAFIVDSLEMGGAERMAVSIVNSISNLSHDVSLIVMRKSGPLEKRILPKVLFLILGKKNSYDIISFFRFRRYINSGNFDIIHAHSSTVIWAILVKISGLKVKIIWHDHYGGNALDRSLIRKVVKLFSNQIDFIISVNLNLMKWAKINFPKSKVECLNNFPDLLFMELERTEQILLLANFRPQKDHGNFLKAMSILKIKFGIEPKFILIGSLVDINYVAQIRKMINDLNLVNQCLYLGPAEIPEKYLYSSKIGVLSSLSEGLPVSLLEYGLAGLIPISTNVGDCARVISNNGYLVEAKKPEKLADAIYLALKSPEAEQKALDFKQHVLSEFGSIGFITKYINFITK